MKKFVLVLIIFSSLGVSAQQISFLKSYGNTGFDFGRDVKQYVDTGYISTGSSSSFGTATADAFLLKVDSMGNFQWSYNYGGPDTEWGESVIVTMDNEFALSGYTNSWGNGGFDFYLVRTDSLGNPLWEKTYGGSDWDRSYDLAQLPDSGFILVGETYSYGAGGRDAWLVRTDKNGDTLWTKTFGGNEDDYLNAVYVDGDSIVVVGGTESFGSGMSDGLIIKMDFNGDIGWSKVLGETNEDYFTCIDAHNLYYAVGGISSFNYAVDKEDMWVYKISKDGLTTLLDTSYDSSPENDGITDLHIKPFGEDIVFGGYTYSFGQLDGYGDMFINKFTSNWYYLINYHFGDVGKDAIYAMDYTNDDGVIAIGEMQLGSTGGTNMVLLKINYAWDWIDVLNDVEYENITLTIEDESHIEFNVYPTPIQDFLTIESPYQIESIEVIDMNGKSCYSEELPDNKINLSDLDTGIYILKISTSDFISTVKIIKS